jgi:hypothetical protein
MTNYIVEGNVNFFEELYKSLDEEETNGFTEGKEQEKKLILFMLDYVRVLQILAWYYPFLLYYIIQTVILESCNTFIFCNEY